MSRKPGNGNIRNGHLHRLRPSWIVDSHHSDHPWKLWFPLRLGLLVPWGYVLAGLVFYALFSRGGTVLWLVPYLMVIVSPPGLLKFGGNFRTTILAFYAAMSEQVTLNVLSIMVLGLFGAVWAGVARFMFVERAIATLGGTSLVVALRSRLGER